MADITHRIGIKAPISNVYSALATTEGVGGWWSKDTSGTSKPGETIEICFNTPEGKELGRMEMEVIALEQDKKVHWRFKEGPNEWLGTDVVFDLYKDGDYTIVLFGHRNWREEVEFTSHCSMKWATFLLSLRDFVETGNGKPSPNDMKIDNWN